MKRNRLLRAIIPCFLLALAFSSEAGAAAPRAKGRAQVSSALSLYYKRRPSADGSGRVLGGDVEAPVLIKFASAPTAQDVLDLQAIGVSVELRNDGSPRGVGDAVAAGLRASAVGAVASLPRVVKIALDGAPFAPPPPLDGTAAEIQATDAWRSEREPLGHVTGKGVIICDIDSGVDPFHPLFYRADGGYFNWVDMNGDGIFSPAVDGIDLKGDGQVTVLRVLDSLVTDFFSDEPRFDSDDPGYAIGMDWLYADANGNGARDYGAMAGFTEADPTYGERLFVADDVNKNGMLDVGEKIVALGSSKIRVVRQNKKKYRRGENLVNIPANPDCAHGTGASGVMVGGNIGLTRLVGIAPDAELVMATNTDGSGDVALADFCVDEGARVVLHEYAPWVGYHLDGSSDLESFIDETVKKGVAHINPAGNLSTSKKLYKHTIPAGEETIIPIDAAANNPYGPFGVLGLSILWRDPSRALKISLEDPTGVTMAVAADPGQVVLSSWSPGLALQSFREDSTRGTARSDTYVYKDDQSPSPKTIPSGTWKLHVVDSAPAGSPGLELIAYVLDEVSGWGQGIYFPEFSSEDHLIGYPGTADHGLAVAAYTGHGWNGGTPGERAYYSGRGRRIDGVENLWISGPDDPITSGYREGSPAVDFIYGGTSGASPHVAGAAALLIQADPSRTGDDVREAIKAGALVDADVGKAPNEDYGNGKLRVYRSLFGEDPPGGAAPSIKIERTTVELGDEAKVAIEVADPDEPASGLRVEVDRDYDGTYEEKLAEPILPVKFDALGVYTSKVQVTDATGRTAAALAVVEVIPKKPVPAAKEPLQPSGGCGCAANEQKSEIGAWAFGALALGALGARSRDRRRRR